MTQRPQEDLQAFLGSWPCPSMRRMDELMDCLQGPVPPLIAGLSAECRPTPPPGTSACDGPRAMGPAKKYPSSVHAPPPSPSSTSSSLSRNLVLLPVNNPRDTSHSVTHFLINRFYFLLLLLASLKFWLIMASNLSTSGLARLPANLRGSFESVKRRRHNVSWSLLNLDL